MDTQNIHPNEDGHRTFRDALAHLDAVFNESYISSKIGAALEVISTLQDEKVIVFVCLPIIFTLSRPIFANDFQQACFKGTLHILHKFLQKAGVNSILCTSASFTLYRRTIKWIPRSTDTGDESHSDRVTALTKINTDPTCKVLLMSLSAGGAGVYLLPGVATLKHTDDAWVRKA